MTTRVHYRRDPYDVYIGRPSKWGNPFIIGRDGNRGDVVEMHSVWLQHPAQAELRAAARRELKDKALACYCESDQLCHGDNLIDVIEAKA